VQVVVAIELEPLDERERTLDVAGLGHRDRLVELHDRRPRNPRELAVERRDLLPVGRVRDVERGERRLEHVWAAAAECEGALELFAARLDLFGVPA
jgi:hypothetical protein